MMTRNLKLKLNIKDDELKAINKKIKPIISKKITKRECGIYCIPKELFSEDKKVSDEIRYEIEVKNKNVSTKLIKKSIDPKIGTDVKYKDYKRIVIIIESPHRDEYDDDFKPIGPAQGKTGDMIKSNIENIIKLFNITDGKYILIISNPVQFQASLGSFYDNGLHKSIRNNVWSALYKICKEDFIKRLEIYEPDYILNATTAGRKYRVNKAIKTVKSIGNKKNQELKESYHPSFWNNGEITMKKNNKNK